PTSWPSWPKLVCASVKSLLGWQRWTKACAPPIRRSTAVGGRSSGASKVSCCSRGRQVAWLPRRKGERLSEVYDARSNWPTRRGRRALGLGAAPSLARMLHGHERATEARALLDGVCQWFGAGATSPDLIEARALLRQP